MSKKVFKLIIFFLIVFVIIFGFYKYILHKDRIRYETIDYDYQSKCVKEVYKLHPGAFMFDENNECKITVEEVQTISDDYGFEIEHDKDGNMCVGYYIVKRSGDTIEVDSSHICDMINY